MREVVGWIKIIPSAETMNSFKIHPQLNPLHDTLDHRAVSSWDRTEASMKPVLLLAMLAMATTPAVARAYKENVTQTCIGTVHHPKLANPGWYDLGDCTFGPEVSAQILPICRPSETCTIRAVGTLAPDFYIKRITSVCKRG